METTILYNPVFSHNLGPEYGVLETRIPMPIIRIIDKEVKLAREEKISRNKDLAGYIKEEYTLSRLANIDKFKNFLTLLAEKHTEVFPDYYDRICNMTGIKGHQLNLTDPWVNIMKKHEFNPIHNHGGMFSYVIWAQIPFSYEDEIALHPECTAKEQVAAFNFVYPDVGGGVKTTTMHPEQGTPWNMVFFPAGLDHYVSPFYTSDGERISISGNLYFTNNDVAVRSHKVGNLTPEDKILP